MLLVVASACGGPEDGLETSAREQFALAVAKDWSGLYDVVHPAQQALFYDRQAFIDCLTKVAAQAEAEGQLSSPADAELESVSGRDAQTLPLHGTNEDADMVIAQLKVRVDDHEYMLSQPFVRVDGEWRVVITSLSREACEA